MQNGAIVAQKIAELAKSKFCKIAKISFLNLNAKNPDKIVPQTIFAIFPILI